MKSVLSWIQPLERSTIAYIDIRRVGPKLLSTTTQLMTRIGRLDILPPSTVSQGATLTGTLAPFEICNRSPALTKMLYHPKARCKVVGGSLYRGSWQAAHHLLNTF